MRRWRKRRDWPKAAMGGALLLLALLLLLWPQSDDVAEPSQPVEPLDYLFPGGGPLISVLLPDGNVGSIELEQFLVGVVAAEMPATFAPEALKAQAIAARTYIASHLEPYGTPRHTEADICCDSSHCQAYVQPESLKERWGDAYETKYAAICRAVGESKGQVVFYADQPVETPYCSTCGGRTEAARDVWGGDIPYLQSVSCEWDSHAPRFLAAIVLSLEEAAQALQVEPQALSAMTADYTTGGAISQLQIGGKSLSGGELRQRLSLNSAQVNWLVENDTILFSTLGFGHGVGLCQYGADGMAQAGYAAQEILQHYYQDTEIRTLYD